MNLESGELAEYKKAAIYERLFLIRRVEEKIAAVYPSDKIKSPIHLSIGQEAPSVGICEAMKPEDIVFGTYRGHALYLAKGGNLNAMIAELYGKQSGCAKGKGGSMHLCDRDVGMMGTSAIVASTIPQAVGYALAERMKGTNIAVAVFFGDGATEEGVFWESLNFAALKNLPVLFVCENNSYAIHTPLARRVSSPNYCQRVATFGVPATRITGNDVIKIYVHASQVLEEVRVNGPRFLEVETYRWREHVGPAEDWKLGYRNKAEGDFWIASDQLDRIGNMLSSEKRQRIEQDCTSKINIAFNFAETSLFPTGGELYRDVYK